MDQNHRNECADDKFGHRPGEQAPSWLARQQKHCEEGCQGEQVRYWRLLPSGSEIGTSESACFVVTVATLTATNAHPPSRCKVAYGQEEQDQEGGHSQCQEGIVLSIRQQQTERCGQQERTQWQWQRTPRERMARKAADRQIRQVDGTKQTDNACDDFPPGPLRSLSSVEISTRRHLSFPHWVQKHELAPSLPRRPYFGQS